MRDYTDITVLLDRSGSMQSIKDDTIGGFNQFLATQQEAGENASLTLVQFDSMAIDNVCVNTPIRKAKALTGDTFVPRGATPLLDALGTTIYKAGRRLEAVDEADRPNKVVFVIITDGYENASQEYTRNAIKKLITQQEKDYNWQFVYLGANQDAFAEAGQIGIHMSNAAGFAPTAGGVGSTYSAMASNVARFRGSGQSVDLKWSPEQRSKMADENKEDETSGPTQPHSK